jgi:hypothetical protein
MSKWGRELRAYSKGNNYIINIKKFSSLDKYTIVDEAMFISKQKPGIYEPVKIEVIKPRI